MPAKRNGILVGGVILRFWRKRSVMLGVLLQVNVTHLMKCRSVLENLYEENNKLYIVIDRILKPTFALLIGLAMLWIYVHSIRVEAV